MPRRAPRFRTSEALVAAVREECRTLLRDRTGIDATDEWVRQTRRRMLAALAAVVRRDEVAETAHRALGELRRACARGAARPYEAEPDDGGPYEWLDWFLAGEWLTPVRPPKVQALPAVMVDSVAVIFGHPDAPVWRDELAAVFLLIDKWTPPADLSIKDAFEKYGRRHFARIVTWPRPTRDEQRRYVEHLAKDRRLVHAVPDGSMELVWVPDVVRRTAPRKPATSRKKK